MSDTKPNDIDPNTPENMALRREWADKNIYACVTSLVHKLIGDNFTEEGWSEDLFCVADPENEEEYLEPLSFFAVSIPLAWELKKRGQPVAEDVYGLCVWGRTTCGQLCYIDAVMEDIWLSRAKDNVLT